MRPRAYDAPKESGRSKLWIGLSAWALVAVVALLWANAKVRGGLASLVPGLGSSIDGTYVSGEYTYPMTLKIEGGKGDIDFGFVCGNFMEVERHGDTVTFSGGVAADASGRVLSPEERRALTGGNDVDVFTIANDGRTLKLDMGDGRTVTFAKQVP